MKSLKFTIFTIILAIALSGIAANAQLSRKPSALREPDGAMDKKPDSKKNSLPKIATQADFDSIARVYHQGTPYAMPHTMFIIDRRAKNKIYYVNSQKFRFHKDFLLATYLVPRGADVFKPIYIDEDRRFIVGTIAWQKPVERFTWELWEGDLANVNLIKTANEVINGTFFQKVAYKPNSIRQEDVSAEAGLERILQNDLNKNQEYLALNTGKAIGRIHIIDKIDDTVEIGDNEILVLKELPLSLPPVRGIIVAKPSSPLSHINILAKGWNIPNVYIKDADKLFKELNTYWIELDAGLTDYKFKRATKDILDKIKPPDEQIPPADMKTMTLASLRQMRKRDSIIYGSKSANLGEMLNANIPGIIVPDGFTVPFYWYDKFIKDNKINETIEQLLDDNDFIHNPRYRRQKLDALRTAIQNGKFDDKLRREIIAKWRTQLGGKPVFIRSSSNSEDLPNFSGAGLYSSVPNVREDDKLIEAVKKVWGSLWKFEAYEARVRNYVSQTDVYMSALIQLGIDMEKGGVMITKDPFDPKSKNSVYISAVCGHNSKVVDNTGIPEQILFNPRSNSVIVMTLSDQTNALRFDDNGDLKETADKCAGAKSRVLTDVQARDLAKTAIRIRGVFGGKKEQDIEWGIMKGRIFVVQSRPYIDK
ncbi:MAG: PEP/pyruvate-binding domain-containing protein [Pyrinomonadaceae bacterium]|nr:PEP/pyruvate-binding domain-containing protein [Pyrinomonadaceae bacterium]MBP6212213.1 PEP/pyruvate-binding domain-containing protein [Pyrinomonadaceae bacterium]